MRRTDVPKRHLPLVYYVASQYGGIVKIGTTMNLEARLRRLEVVQPSTTLRVLATEPGDARTEHRRHFQFQHAYHQGEWFWLTPDLRQHIESLGGQL